MSCRRDEIGGKVLSFGNFYEQEDSSDLETMMNQKKIISRESNLEIRPKAKLKLILGAPSYLSNHTDPG